MPVALIGQADTIVIPQVVIVEQSIRKQSAGSTTQSWNAAEESKEVNDLGSLLDQNGVYIKSYGSNSLATSSIRGGSAGHTLVMWNGLPIQSPMLGLLNLTLLPLNSVEEITLQKGGGSALWGSGAIGGVIDLKNRADFENKFSLSSNTIIGSFGRFNEQLKVAVGNEKFQFVTKVLQELSDNDFTYEVAPGIPDRQQTHADFRQLNVLHDFYYRGNNGHRLSAHFWKQNSHKELPPTITQNQSGAHQDDRATRFILNWQKVGKSIVINSKAAWFNEHLDYFNDLNSLVSLSHFNTLLGESTAQYVWRKNHSSLFGISHSFTHVHADGYKESPEENKTALFVSHQYQADKIQIHSTLRQEFLNGRRLPLTPDIGVDYMPFGFLVLKAKVSRNFRLPTFNDRYWAPGGNADLLAESGWSQEATLEFNHHKGPLSISLSSTVFNRTIENWIKWLPTNGQFFWSAHNIAEVWSRGLEERLSLSYRTNDLTIQLQLGYDYIKSTNEVALERPVIEKGVQLLYTPEHQGFSAATVGWQDFSLTYRHIYRGSSRGVNGLLEDYHTGRFQLQYDWAKAEYGASLFATVRNAWDVNYFVVERRPMAGRWYQLGLKVSFSKN